MIATLLAPLSIEPATAQTTISFKSEHVELPTGERLFPGGDKADAINNNCLACHSAGMVLNQPPLTETEWSTEVHKMISTYKAPVSPEDANSIIAYLVRTKGKP